MADTPHNLVLRFGFNATAYQILNPGIEHWLMPNQPAVVGFVRHGRTWVVAGAPVCPQELIPGAIQSFERHAARHRARVCYVCAASRLHSILASSKTHSSIAIGAQPVWNPAHWPALLKSHANIRAQLRRAANKNVSIEHWRSPSPAQLASLQNILSVWLASRPLPPLTFLTGTNALDAGVADRVLLVALHGGQPDAFLLASPIPQRRGYLVEQIIRRPTSPNGTAELLIDSVMRYTAEISCEHLTLGLVALSRHAHPQIRLNPAWLRLLMTWARAHGRRFYHFDGLEMFRTKLAPAAWEPIYAISNEPHFSPATLYAIAAAFTGGKPLRTLATALASAVKREAAWLVTPARR